MGDVRKFLAEPRRSAGRDQDAAVVRSGFQRRRSDRRAPAYDLVQI